jgi:hypothetical protein
MAAADQGIHSLTITFGAFATQGTFVALGALCCNEGCISGVAGGDVLVEEQCLIAVALAACGAVEAPAAQTHALG